MARLRGGGSTSLGTETHSEVRFRSLPVARAPICRNQLIQRRWDTMTPDARAAFTKKITDGCRKGAAEYYGNFCAEDMQARTDKLLAGQAKWNEQVIEGKGTNRKVMAIDTVERMGLLSYVRLSLSTGAR